jgi:2-desacetyl-2-hydroxyethyl bacteriochlorophyllide A dehydrogenase
MKALVIDAVGHSGFTEVEQMALGAGDVRLDVRHVGLCGSDLNTFNGLNPLVELPRIPGHEIGGVVAETGADVSPDITVGASALVIPYTTCGTCKSCLSGRVNACRFNRTLGVQQDGGLRDQIVVAQDRLILNSMLPDAHLALVEPLSVGFHAVRRGRVTDADTVLVLGGGMIGIGVILGAMARGARVIVSEVSQTKQAALKALGVATVINPMTQDLAQEIATLTDEHGPDVVIEAVGLPETFRAAVDLAAFSGRVVYVGYAKSDVSYNTSLFNLKELDIMGSRNAVREDFEAVIAYLEAHSSVADPLISKRFLWGDADQALDYWQQNRDTVFKILIDLTTG